MAVLTVFSNNLDPNNPNLTIRFTRATGFYIDAPLLSSEMEIDVFLQVYFPIATGERVRNLALGKLKDGQIKLNETDTETVVAIPNEFVDTGLEMALLFLSSDTTYLEVYVIQPSDRFDEINQKLDLILNNLSIPQPVNPVSTNDNLIILQLLGFI